MILISHRGNLNGYCEKENSPFAISAAATMGFDVEVDFRGKDGKIYLGHNEPEYLLEESFLNEFRDKLWVHCKDKYALAYAIDEDLNCFFHTKDDYTLTNKGFIWAYPGIDATGRNSIAVLPEIYFSLNELKNKTYAGYCSDVILDIKRELDV